MNEFFVILKNVLIFVALAMPGYILVKSKLLKSSDCGVLSKLLTSVGMPFLILSGTLQVELNAEFAITAGISAIIFVIVTVIIYELSLPLTYKLDDQKKLGMMRFSVIYSNNGFLGLPLAMAVFSDNVVAILIIMNLLQNLITIDFGSALVSGEKLKLSPKKIFLNPILIAFVLGLVLNLTGILGHLPELKTFSDYLKNIVTPISMTILGMKLADVQFSAMLKSSKMYYVSALKLVLLPIIGVAVAIGCKLLFSLSTDIILATFVCFAMPTAGLASTLADQHDGDVEGAVFYTLGTTILSVLSIPLLYLLLTVVI